MVRRRPLLIALSLTLLATSTHMAPAGAIPGPAPAITVTTVLSGLHRPWDIAFTPGGGMLFTERAGSIRFKVAHRTEVRTLAVPTDVVAQGEGGMMGVAVDPGFVENRRIYACFMSDKGGSLDVRLVRFRINEAVTALTDRVDIVTGIPATSGRHSGCRPRFGPDGHIWMGTGDATQPEVPQSKTSLGGKVLRVDTNGNGVPGNPTAPFDHRIYTYGHRNVQGITFSPGGKAYAIEHGTGRDDEINRLFAGANYGWDPRPLSGPSFYDESRPMTDKTRHPAARSAVWSSGHPTIAPSGGTFLSGDRWKGWNRALAMAVLKDHHLRIMRFDINGASIEKQEIRITDQGRLRVAVLNPRDNNLYLATDQDPGKILRVTPR